METKPWAAVTVEPDGRVAVWVHNWIKAGIASNPEELWELVLSGWHKPGYFWDLFYAEMAQQAGRALEKPARREVDPKLRDLSIDDLGI